MWLIKKELINVEFGSKFLKYQQFQKEKKPNLRYQSPIQITKSYPLTINSWNKKEVEKASHPPQRQSNKLEILKYSINYQNKFEYFGNIKIILNRFV